MISAAVRSKAVVLLLSIHCLFLLQMFFCCFFCFFRGGGVFGPCFAIKCLVSFLVLQSSLAGEERARCFALLCSACLLVSCD